VKFTKRQQSILIGTVLGDGFLQKTGKKNARLRLEHGGKQREYLMWKASQFPKLFQGKPLYIERMHPISKKKYEYWRQQSNSTPELGAWRQRFYPEGKKRIPGDLEVLLSDTLSLAVWYMDDGYYYARDRVSYLYLGRVTRNEADIAKHAIEKNFNLKSNVYDKKNEGFALYFTTKEARKFHKLIRRHILPLFRHKLSEELRQSP
jgi:hypothetical protein